MKTGKKHLSILLIFSLLFGVFSLTSSTVVNAEISAYLNEQDSQVIVSDEGIFVDGIFYSEETFEELLATSPYTETQYDLEYTEPVSSEISTMSISASIGGIGAGLIKGTWWIPGIGKVVVTAVGSVIVAGAVIKSGTWVHNKVKAYFAERSYENAKKNGSKAPKHSNQSTASGSSLSRTGTPLSSRDLLDNKGTKQRRYYGKNGQAELDIDYRHAGNYKFPHRHTWKNGVRSGH